MGTNIFSTKNPGDVISDADPNQYKTGLDGDVVPRNASGIPEDVAGNLGSTLYRWATAYIQKIYLGVAGNLVSLEEDASAFLVKISGSTKAKVDADGLDGSYLKASSVPYSSFASDAQWKEFKFDPADGSSQDWVVPAGVNVIGVKMWGGGGGGGGGGLSGAAGGGGGSGSMPVDTLLKVIPGETLTWGFGSGGAGGAVNTNGTDGATSSITATRDALPVTLIQVAGGKGGKTSTSSAGGNGGAGGWSSTSFLTDGGKGADSSSANGDNGTSSFFAAGGAAGNMNAGGGGGGAGYGFGGNGGGVAPEGSHDGHAGADGGGGGGGSQGKAGGAGGSPGAIIYYIGVTPT